MFLRTPHSWRVIAVIAALHGLAGPVEAGGQDGVYRARGYGWVLDRRTGTPAVYHLAGFACWPEPDVESLSGMFDRAIPRPDGSVGLTEADGDQATVYVFDRLSFLPAACTQETTTDWSAVMGVADLMQAHYPGFEARGVDFSERRATVLGALSARPTSAVAFAAAEALLAGLNDPHIELSAEIDGEDRELAASEGRTLDAVHARGGYRPERTWLGAWRTGVETTILGGQGHVAANNRVFWGVRDGVGYLTVLTMGGFDPEDDAALAPLDAALDEAMAAFAGTRAVIVDVSNNRGGYDAVSRRIAARFTDRPRTAYLKRARGEGLEWQVIEARPSERARYLGPVWLLTSDITVSAGETFTQMMRVLPNVTHAGAATRGALSDQTPVTLGNGWRFAMPMEAYADPTGRLLEGRGLEPEVRLDLYPAADLDHGHARAVSALMRRLR